MTEKLTNSELLTVNSDIQEALNQELLYDDALPLWNLQDVVEAGVKNINKLRVDMITELGEKQEDGSTKVPDYADDTKTTLHPNYIKFNEQWQEMLSQEREITFDPIPVKTIQKLKFKEGRGKMLRKFLPKTTADSAE